jgi:phosphoglycolate phosphatase
MQVDDKNNRTIIFDFDGTIADSLDLIIEIFRSLVPGKDDVSSSQIETLRNLSIHHIANTLGVPMWKVPLLVRRGRKVMRRQLDEVTVFDGLPDVLKRFHEQGYVMHVLSSNSNDTLRVFLERHNLAAYFTSINGGIGLFGKKRAIRGLCKRNNIPLSSAWYVGDELRDIVAAKKAGVRIVAVGWGFNHPKALEEMKPDALALTPSDLFRIISVG